MAKALRFSTDWIGQIARDWAIQAQCPDPDAVVTDAIRRCTLLDNKEQSNTSNFDRCIKEAVDTARGYDPDPEALEDPTEVSASKIIKILTARGIQVPPGDRRTNEWRKSAAEALREWKSEGEDE